MYQDKKDLCFKYIYGYKFKQESNLSKEELVAFHKLCRNKNIVICKPVKGNGVVLLDKDEYLRKLPSIISDTDKFEKLSSDPTSKQEGKLQ